MLRDVGVSLAQRCRHLTSVARTIQSLAAMDHALASAGCVHSTVRADWNHRAEFLELLVAHVHDIGAPSLVLAWLHDDTLAIPIANAVAGDDVSCEFYHVRSGTSLNPVDTGPGATEISRLVGSVVYREIILGFHLGPNGSRWLTDAEICAGVLGAIDRMQPRSVVGTVVPWSMRP